MKNTNHYCHLKTVNFPCNCFISISHENGGTGINHNRGVMEYGINHNRVYVVYYSDTM